MWPNEEEGVEEGVEEVVPKVLVVVVVVVVVDKVDVRLPAVTHPQQKQMCHLSKNASVKMVTTGWRQPEKSWLEPVTTFEIRSLNLSFFFYFYT
jgi:hypothetical protein